jgi:hypothetical protein
MSSNANFNDSTPSAPAGKVNVAWQKDGSGNISAAVNALAGVTVGGSPTHAGEVLISQPGNATAVWADPLVQGVFPPGTNVLTANGGSPPAPLNPVLVGAEDPSGNLQNLIVDGSGLLSINAPNGMQMVVFDPSFSPTPLTGTTSGYLNVNAGGTDAVGVAPTRNPVLVGATDPSGLLQRVKVDASGNVMVTGATAVTSTSPPMPVADGTIVPLSATNTGSLRVAVTGMTTAVNIGTLPSLVAGTAVIGHVIVDSAPSTAVTGTVAVSNFPASITGFALEAGGNLAAIKTDLDTLAGTVTTGKVAVSIATLPALTAGSAVIGHVIVDTAPTTAVTIASLPALTAGSAVIGHVIVDSAPSTAVTGTVTANAGTNLNTSLLALETGGNLATLAGTVASGKVKVTPDPISQTASTLPAPTTMQSAVSGNANGTTLPVSGYATAIVSIVSSTPMSGGTVVNFEVSEDNTTWVSILAHQLGASGSLVATTSADGNYRINCAGIVSVRARISGYSAGTTTITGYVSPLSSHPTTVSIAAGASQETSTIYSGTTALTPLFATIVASSSGVTNVLALVGGKRIRVLALQLTANGAVNVKWQSHVTPTDLTGLAYLAANGGYVLPYNPLGWFQTVSGEALDINLSGAVAVGGCLTYVTV